MFNLDNYEDKLSESGYRVLTISIEESKRRKHYYLGLEHVLYALTVVDEELLNEIFADLKIDKRKVLKLLNDFMMSSEQYVGEGLKIPIQTRNLFKSAYDYAQSSGRSLIDSTDFLMVMFQEPNSIPVKVFKSLNIDSVIIADKIFQKIRERKNRSDENKRKYDLPYTLRQHAINLSKLAIMDKLSLVFGREEEITRVMEILCHVDRPNSVIIVGEPGVGKTAIVEGLARKIELEPYNVPPRLRNKIIVNLQMNSLVAGTVFRGMFEDRMEKIINELKSRKNIIIFVDEVHSIIGAGSAIAVPSDAANILKSSLARGEVQIIGATTLSEYKEFIAEDEALARRFRLVNVKEPSIDDTKRILYGLKRRFEDTYDVEIEESAIEESLSLSARYSRSLRLPDKVIGWIDSGCVKAEIYNEDRIVKKENIYQVISQEANMPIDLIKRDVLERFQDMESFFSKRIVGQKEAIDSLAKHIRLNKGPLKGNFDKPDAVLLFLGPTGVGKTETAKAMAEYLFGSPKNIVRVDMSEYKDGSIAVDKLIGMPRGIVGSPRGGILTNQVKDNPYSVILLDEIEKASDQVFNLFLQVFDEGFLTDGRGRRVYFSDSVIIMTSNLGSHEFSRFTKPLGFIESHDVVKSIRTTINKEIENFFSPEFINRIDDIVIFSPLTKEEVKLIAKMHIDSINKTMSEHGKDLTVTDEALDRLVEKGYSSKFGARFLKRSIDDIVKVPLTLKWKDGDSFIADLIDGEVSVAVQGKYKTMTTKNNKNNKEEYGEEPDYV
ncbi:MAG: ATP-dependent Clp protease ATP-binding subunit [Deltaproteobacteria bacterium]|jgi:ATP-dependent Clp protease ATP-binding subunit ClpA|nr:ATP-dependent Clp protease ATP-binding subunit [Deltaproteobacteria bacterium]MCL5880302.1 ATP-dependent Clp protease ATP-binding subunit [Deltaproteobacteria bacterium]MDA8303964.1 ATP-dependent Clp protease ATP-binding subunit [Deltaproteobacteria bacterium]